MPEWTKKLFRWLRKTLGGMVTEHDNQTHSLIKHGGWIGLAAVIACAAHQQVGMKQAVPVKDLAQSITLLLVGVGGGIALGTKGEHQNDQAQTGEKDGAQ